MAFQLSRWDGLARRARRRRIHQSDREGTRLRVHRLEGSGIFRGLRVYKLEGLGHILGIRGILWLQGMWLGVVSVSDAGGSGFRVKGSGSESYELSCGLRFLLS